MGLRSTVIFTTGPAGSGKSYARCAVFLHDEWLPEGDGVHWSNFPLGVVPDEHSTPPAYPGETFVDRLAASVAKRTGRDVAELRQRVRSIPEDELSRWRLGTSGPWDFFRDVDLTGAHVAIDEVHVYCGAKSSKPIKGQWQKWLGEIRHRGATVELLSQHPRKVASELRDEAGACISLSNCQDRRDPFFGILLGDLYELRAALLTGDYTAAVVEVERRDLDGKWVVNRTRRIALTPFYFAFYDSFNAPQSGSGSGAGAVVRKREYERRSRLGLCLWFARRNGLRIAFRGGVVVGGLLFCFNGGGSWMMAAWQSSLSGMVAANQTKQSASAPGGQEQNVAKSETKPVPRQAKIAEKAAASVEGEVDRALMLERERVAKLEREKLELQGRLQQSFAVALLTQDAVTFHGGFSYGVGERIDYGPYAGVQVERIDWARRSVVLGDGRVLRMAPRGAGGADAPAAGGVQPVGEVPSVPNLEAPGKSGGGDVRGPVRTSG